MSVNVRNQPVAIRLFTMEHKGVEFTVVQAANPYGWVWSVLLPGKHEKSGRSRFRRLAIAHGQAVIDEALADASLVGNTGNVGNLT